MTNAGLQSVREALIHVGYRRERIASGVSGPGIIALREGFVAYADRPFDARTSAIVAVDMGELDERQLSTLRSTGAPIVAQCAATHVLFWRQSTEAPQFIARVDTPNVLSYFQKYRDELAPGSIYRAKLWGRTNRSWQLDMFVDGGLLPLVEHTAGEALRHLLEGAVKEAKSALRWKSDVDPRDGAWLLKAVFWLLAAKILQDKGVRGFSSLSLSNVEHVYATLAKHYNRRDPQPLGISSAKKRQALVSVASRFEQSANMSAVTTESLAWVYESALIDKLTRQELGTHSTPTWLIDDIVAKLRPWIEEMDVEDRRVFEPACGHAGFLIAAMRLLSQLLPADRADERKDYLRQRLRGIEVDAFAHEVGRLALTLADVPNGNGWLLDLGDMFQGNALRSAVSQSTIVLANPPFEKFGATRPEGAEYFNRADETFRHIVEGLPMGGVFGVVVPQTFLRSAQAQRLHRLLLDEYDLADVTLFADKVFNYGDAEIAVLIGRRVGSGPKRKTVEYRRVRESHVEIYKKTLVPSSSDPVERERLTDSLFVPELHEVWEWLYARGCARLDAYVDGGQGFQHKGVDDPTLPVGALLESETAGKGLVRGFSGWDDQQYTHELPEPVWFNLDKRTISRPRHGIERGRAQILINYAPISREAWRMKCLVDDVGHPVKSRFLVFRPANAAISTRVLWALCNSPVANAFVYAYCSKREILSGTLGQMPVFPLDQGSFEPLEAAVRAYFQAAKGVRPQRKKSRGTKPGADMQLSLLDEQGDDAAQEARYEQLKILHWRIDAEVLRLYGLPAWAERKILNLFTGMRRRGVPFHQETYFPRGFSALDRLSDLLAITADWPQTNERRCELIAKKIKKTLTEGEIREFDYLDGLADARCAFVNVLYPSGPSALDVIAEELKREGQWIE